MPSKPLYAFLRGGDGPVTLALGARGAGRANSRRFRTLGGLGELSTSLAEMSFEVAEVPDRPGLQNGRGDSGMGVRLVPNASSALGCNMRAPPPATRRVGVREVLDVPSPPGEVGYQASMNTDACLRYSEMGHQSSVTPFESCGAHRSVLTRLMGQASKGRSGSTEELAHVAPL